MISHTSGELQKHFYCKYLALHQKLFSGTVGGRDTTRSTVNIGYRVLSTLQQPVQNAISNKSTIFEAHSITGGGAGPAHGLDFEMDTLKSIQILLEKP